MQPEEEKIYEILPLIYGHLMRKISYKIWAEYIATIISEYVPDDAHVLELAAGNCKFANYFVYFYPNLFVTDLSKNMLASDKKKLVPKIACDMRFLPFKTKFDLVYSTFDSVNYLVTKQKLLGMFKQVSASLTEDGVFLFDASLERNSIIHTKIPNREGKYKGIIFQQKSEYNAKNRIHTNSFLIKSQDGKLYTEIHRQKIYPFEVYFELLDKAGMYVVKCYNGFSFKDGGPDSERVQFITKRKNK